MYSLYYLQYYTKENYITVNFYVNKIFLNAASNIKDAFFLHLSDGILNIFLQIIFEIWIQFSLDPSTALMRACIWIRLDY